MNDKIDRFVNEHFFLSNYYDAPIKVYGISYKNNEAAFQASKSLDPAVRMVFSNLSSSEAKKKGRAITLRKDWESVKVQIMKDLIHAKFEQNPDLREKLLKTGDVYLEEGNDWGDRIWGTVNGIGANLLGRILMEERESIRNQK
ncbi:MAG: NADAR family protein [Bacillota bacterium]|nr:NADAR family protein [Bacillota bacterium]